MKTNFGFKINNKIFVALPTFDMHILKDVEISCGGYVDRLTSLLAKLQVSSQCIFYYIFLFMMLNNHYLFQARLKHMCPV